MLFIWNTIPNILVKLKVENSAQTTWRFSPIRYCTPNEDTKLNTARGLLFKILTTLDSVAESKLGGSSFSSLPVSSNTAGKAWSLPLECSLVVGKY